MLAALGRLRRIAGELRGPGTFNTLFEDAISYGEMNELLSKTRVH
jgi:hypothetical protein